MRKDGIYHVSFSTSAQNKVEGPVIARRSTLNGDAGYLYRSNVEETGEALTGVEFN